MRPNRNNIYFKIEVNDTNTITVNSAFPVMTEKKNDEFIISTPVFPVFAYGKTEEEALENFNNSINDFFYSLISKGRLQLTKWLKQLGWELKDKINENGNNFDKFKIKEIDDDLMNAMIQSVNNTMINTQYTE